MSEADISPLILDQEDDKLDSFDRKHLYTTLSIYLNRLERHYDVAKHGPEYLVRKRIPQVKPIRIYKLEYPSVYHHACLYFFALNEHGGLMGVRETHLDKEQSQKIVASGNIDVLERGKGIAHTLESVHEIVLQNIINESPQYHVLTYEIQDANLSRKVYFEDQLRIAKGRNDQRLISEIEQTLERKRKERVAWERLYSPGGVLGFTKEGEKITRIFSPGQKVGGEYEIEEYYTQLDMRPVLEKAIHGVDY